MADYSLNGSYQVRTPGDTYQVNFNLKDYTPTTNTITVSGDGPYGGFGTEMEVNYIFSGDRFAAGAEEEDSFEIVIPDEWSIVLFTQGFVGETNFYIHSIYDEEGSILGHVTTVGKTTTSIVHCFTPGALIETPDGPRRIETLQPGDLVTTRDQGPQPVRWVGATDLTAETLAQFPDRRPIRIAAGALGDNAETMVSPAHRFLLDGWRAEALFGHGPVLAAARDLVNDSTIRVAHDVDSVTYVHVMFDQHQIVCVDGAWSESFHPGSALTGEAIETRDEILVLFPEFEAGDNQPLAGRALSADQVAIYMAG